MRTMNNTILKSVSELTEIAGRLSPASVVIPGGDRLEDLRVIDSARDLGIVDRVILVAKKDEIDHSIENSGLEVDAKDIIIVEDDQQIAAKTVALLKDNQADIVLKGNISTPIINRAMLSVAKRKTVSLASIFDAAPISQGRPIILTDAGMTTVCSLDRMVGIINNAVDVAQGVMGIEKPKVAVLSANEKQIPSLPSTKLGLELAQKKWDNAFVCGPLSFDLATSQDSVRIKGMPNLPNAEEVAGKADILACPGIDSANILYKVLTSMTKYGEASIAGITVGFIKPYVILSRADTLETRLESIALCSIYSDHTKNGQR